MLALIYRVPSVAYTHIYDDLDFDNASVDSCRSLDPTPNVRMHSSHSSAMSFNLCLQ